MRWTKFLFDAAHKRELTEADYLRAGISERFWDATLEKIPKTAEYRAVLETYIKTIDEQLASGNGLFIVGPHGTGKTCAGIVIAKEFIARGGTALFLEEFRLISTILEGVQFDSNMSYRERMDDAHLLIVDDLGLAAISDNLHVTEEVIKYRFQRRRCTIITTNLAKDKFEARYPTIASGLKEACLNVVCQGIPWRDENKRDLKSKFGS